MPDLEVARLEPLSAGHRRQLWAWIGNRAWFEKAGRAFADSLTDSTDSLKAQRSDTMSTVEEVRHYIDWTCPRPECGNVQTTIFKGVIDPMVRIFGCSRCRTLMRFAVVGVGELPPKEPYTAVPLVGPSGEYAQIGALALQRMSMPPAVDTPRLPPSDGGAP